MNSQRVYIAAGVMEIGSLIPGVGAIFDTVNVGLYASQKDWLNMGLSAVSAGLEFAQVAGALAGAGKMIANAADDIGDTLTTTGKNLDDVLDVGESSIKSSVLSIEDAEAFAFDAIKGGKNADSVVLGKFENGASTSYNSVAKEMGAQYFQLDNWADLESKYSADEIWKINERFLDIQTSSGREIYLSHDPIKYIGDNSFYSKELEYLIDNGYNFVKEGDIWHAVR